MTLYRGITGDIAIGVVENTYLCTPRKPRNSAEFVHKIADEWFENKFGIRARSRTIFCTQDINQAKQYGKPYKISLPLDESYSLIFSTNVHDIMEMEGELRYFNNKEEIINWLESKEYKIIYSLTDLPEKFNGEIMLYCKKYELNEIKDEKS